MTVLYEAVDAVFVDLWRHLYVRIAAWKNKRRRWAIQFNTIIFKMYDFREMNACLTCSAQTWWPVSSVASGSTQPETDRILSERPLLPLQRQQQQHWLGELWKHYLMWIIWSFKLKTCILTLYCTTFRLTFDLVSVCFTLAGGFLSSPVAMTITGEHLVSM